MSGPGYFDRIAARALEQVPVVLPRRPAVFELPPGGNDGEARDAREEPGADRSRGRHPSTGSAAGEIRVDRAESFDFASDAIESRPRAERSADSLAAGNTSHTSPLQDRQRSEPDTGSMFTASSTVQARAPVTSPPVVVHDDHASDTRAGDTIRTGERMATRSDVDDAAPSGDLRSIEERLLALERARERRQTSAGRDTRSAMSRPAAPIRSEQSPHPDRIAARRTDRRGRLEHRQAEPPLVDRADPVIEVTIGRIEVRATQAPPAISPRADSGPRLSLDEYLRRRGR